MQTYLRICQSAVRWFIYSDLQTLLEKSHGCIRGTGVIMHTGRLPTYCLGQSGQVGSAAVWTGGARAEEIHTKILTSKKAVIRVWSSVSLDIIRLSPGSVRDVCL